MMLIGGLFANQKVSEWLFSLYGEALISWKFKKHEIVARSSAEAEFRSMASTAAELVWLTGLFGELGIELQMSVHLICVTIKLQFR